MDSRSLPEAFKQLLVDELWEEAGGSTSALRQRVEARRKRLAARREELADLEARSLEAWEGERAHEEDLLKRSLALREAVVELEQLAGEDSLSAPELAALLEAWEPSPAFQGLRARLLARSQRESSSVLLLAVASRDRLERALERHPKTAEGWRGERLLALRGQLRHLEAEVEWEEAHLAEVEERRAALCQELGLSQEVFEEE